MTFRPHPLLLHHELTTIDIAYITCTHLTLHVHVLHAVH